MSELRRGQIVPRPGDISHAARAHRRVCFRVQPEVAMKISSTLIVTAIVTLPCAAGAETFQLWLEIFDEARNTTVCKYYSGNGKSQVQEYSGRYLCPRVACKIPPAETPAVANSDCLPVKATPLT